MRGMIKLRGTVTFSIIGAFYEEFLNDLLSQKIRLDNIHSKDGIIYATSPVNKYLCIARASKKYGIRTRVIERKGLYFKVNRFTKRPGLIIGVLISAVIVNILRLYVWNIVIHNTNELTDDYVLELLDGYGITAGTLAEETNTLETERLIMLNNDRINWINIEINGSRADVYLSENTHTPNNELDLMTPCNIVAAKTGVIVDSDITSGKMLYETGSGVAEGSVIVSGAVSSESSTILVHSDGHIIAEFYEDPVFEMNYTSTEKIPTGETFTHKQLMLLGIVLPLDSNNSDISNTICTEQTEQCSLWGFELPIRIKTDTYTRYAETNVTRTEDDVRRQLENKLEMYQFNFMSNYEILSAEKDYEVTETGAVLKAHIKLRGDIGVKQPIYEH